MSVLIFAPPQADLALQQREVATIINAFHRPLLAHTEDELRHAIEAATEDIEGFWFIGHGGPHGIIANGQTLTPAVIGQYLSVAGVEWSYFSSCESASFIRKVQDVYAHDAYAYIVEVLDTAAWRTAALIAAKYADVGDIHQSVRAAAPTNSTELRFFPSGTGSGGEMGQKELDKVEVLSQQLTALEKVLIGDQYHREDGLIETVRTLKRDVESMRVWFRFGVVGLFANVAVMLAVLVRLMIA